MAREAMSRARAREKHRVNEASSPSTAELETSQTSIRHCGVGGFTEL